MRSRTRAHFNGPGVAWDGSAWVPTGTEYRGNSVYNRHFQAREPFPWNRTITSEVRVISSGPASDMRFREVVHVTVNANGDATADVGEGGFTCG